MKARRKAQQLELPMPLAEGVALREELAWTREELAQLQEDAARWAQHFTWLDQERHTLLRERNVARREVEDLKSQVRATQLLLELQSDRLKTTPAAVPCSGRPRSCANCLHWRIRTDGAQGRMLQHWRMS